MDVTHILAALKLIKRERVIDHDRSLCSVDSGADIETVVEDTQDAAIVHSNLAIAVALQEITDKLAEVADVIGSTAPKDPRPLLIQVGTGVWINPRNIVSVFTANNGHVVAETVDGKRHDFAPTEGKTPGDELAGVVDFINY